MKFPSAGHDGFTLIETLVALVVMGLISLLLGDLVRTTETAWRTVLPGATPAGGDALVAAFITDRLATAVPRPRGGMPMTIAFDGRADSVTFLAPAPDALGGSGFAQYTLQLVHAPAKEFTLEVTVRHERSLGTEPPTSRALEHIVHGEFAYFGKPTLDAIPGWRNEWRAATGLPSLIRVRLTFGQPHTHIWPDIVVAPRVYADAMCHYDSTTRACQGS